MCVLHFIQLTGIALRKERSKDKANDKLNWSQTVRVVWLKKVSPRLHCVPLMVASPSTRAILISNSLSRDAFAWKINNLITIPLWKYLTFVYLGTMFHQRILHSLMLPLQLLPSIFENLLQFLPFWNTSADNSVRHFSLHQRELFPVPVLFGESFHLFPVIRLQSAHQIRCLPFELKLENKRLIRSLRNEMNKKPVTRRAFFWLFWDILMTFSAVL